MDSLSPLTLRKMDRVAASRQKSCNTCVRGKRKCDKRTPRCTRCAAKGLDCVYQKIPPGASYHDEGLGVAAADDVHDFDMGFDIEALGDSSTTSTSTCTTTSPESTGFHTTSNTNTTTNTTSIQLDSSLDFSIIDQLMANETSPSGAELWNLGDFSNASKMDIPLVPTLHPHPPAIRDLAMLQDNGDCVMGFNPLDVYDTRTRIGYVVDVVTHLYRDFATTRVLPFVHPRLYGSNLPRTMLAAFSAATAYAGRTPENRAWVYKLVSEAARDIHREGERADTAAEKIARVQALLILDSIRMFDGDVGMRAATEREAPQALAWLSSLTELRTELEAGVSSEVLMSRDRPPASWEVRDTGICWCREDLFADLPSLQSWILLESIRRTIMMAFSFTCITFMLKAQEPPCDIMESIAFTTSRYLWNADSSVAFFQAWHHKPQFRVSDMDFKDVWMYARPEDIDDFTKLMLTAQSGPDAMDYFMMGNSNVSVGA
ncbi:hypothetical protein B0J13DRAFT_75889 [Dactylonectria estremocensis]|uniref:Zn(2)-C6 fungal-type domain-containing protein n=1 Tax=Dactylonectria estremocensis TaxID=1079267 RepID=A0A9P9EHL7_9HYPO|nr:hypothetical protein B0J13DRAFT_75889 [Dactylonectria estremocensis]